MPVMMRIRLIRRLAEQLDGIDVSAVREGDVIDLPRPQAALLVAEGWARPSHTRREVRTSSAPHIRAVSADAATRRRTVEQLRRAREHMEQKGFAESEQRRREDRLREELHDSRAVTISSADQQQPE
jgi:hypothetical protein